MNQHFMFDNHSVHEQLENEEYRSDTMQISMEDVRGLCNMIELPETKPKTNSKQIKGQTKGN